MRKINLAGPLLAALALAGCGGGSGGSASGPLSRAGRLSVTITWPERTRLVPKAANYVKFTVTDAAGKAIKDAAGGDGSFGMSRPTGTPQKDFSTATSPVLESAPYKITASAYAAATDTVPLAVGSADVVITDGGTTNFTITMQSKVTQFKVVLPGANTATVKLDGTVTGAKTFQVPAGGWATAQPVTVTPQDGTNDLVLLPTAGSNSGVLSITGHSNDLTVSGSTDTSTSLFTANVRASKVTAAGESYLLITYKDGTSTNPTTFSTLLPFQVEAPTNVTATAVFNNPPAAFLSGNAKAIAKATISDGINTFAASSSSITGGKLTFSFTGVTDQNVSFKPTVTLSLKDESGNEQVIGTATGTYSHLSTTLDCGALGTLLLSLPTQAKTAHSGDTLTATTVDAKVGGTTHTFAAGLFDTTGTSSTSFVTLTPANGTPFVSGGVKVALVTPNPTGTATFPIKFDAGALSATGNLVYTVTP